MVDRPGRPIVLIERKYPPYGWALPGGFVDVGERLEHAAIREAKEGILAALGEDYADRREEVSEILGDLQRRISRDLILKEGRRIDGRRFDEVTLHVSLRCWRDRPAALTLYDDSASPNRSVPASSTRRRGGSPRYRARRFRRRVCTTGIGSPGM